MFVGVDNLVEDVAICIAALGLVTSDGTLTHCVVVVHCVVCITNDCFQTLGYERQILVDRQVHTQVVRGGSLVTKLSQLNVGVVERVTRGEFAIFVEYGECVGRTVVNPHVDVARTLNRLYVGCHVTLHTERYGGIFAQVHIDVSTEVVADVVYVATILTNLFGYPVILAGVDSILTLLVVNRYCREVAHVFTTTRDVYTQFLVQGNIPHQHLLPVYVGIELGVGTVVHCRQLFLGILAGLRSCGVGVNCLVVEYRTLVGIQILRTVGCVGETLLVTCVHFCGAVETAFGSNQNYAVSTTNTIHCGCRSVFQNTETLDLQGVYVAHRTLDTIDEHQRIAVTGKGTDTTDPELSIVFTGLTRTLHRNDTCHTTTNRVGKRTNRNHKFLGLNGAYGTNDRFFPLLAKAHDNHVLHSGSIAFEHDAGSGSDLFDLHGYCFVAKIGDLQNSVCGDVHHKTTVQICRSSKSVVANNGNGSTDQWIAIVINNHTSHGYVLRKQRRNRHQHNSCEQTNASGKKFHKLK